MGAKMGVKVEVNMDVEMGVKMGRGASSRATTQGKVLCAKEFAVLAGLHWRACK